MNTFFCLIPFSLYWPPISLSVPCYNFTILQFYPALKTSLNLMSEFGPGVGWGGVEGKFRRLEKSVIGNKHFFPPRLVNSKHD